MLIFKNKNTINILEGEFDFVETKNLDGLRLTVVRRSILEKIILIDKDLGSFVDQYSIMKLKEDNFNVVFEPGKDIDGNSVYKYSFEVHRKTQAFDPFKPLFEDLSRDINELGREIKLIRVATGIPKTAKEIHKPSGHLWLIKQKANLLKIN